MTINVAAVSSSIPGSRLTHLSLSAKKQALLVSQHAA